MNENLIDELIYEVHFFFDKIEGNEPYTSTLLFVGLSIFDVLAIFSIIIDTRILQTVFGSFGLLIMALTISTILVHRRITSDAYIIWADTHQPNNYKVRIIFLTTVAVTVVFILMMHFTYARNQ